VNTERKKAGHPSIGHTKTIDGEARKNTPPEQNKTQP
jgi:hypothetical protein